MVNKGINQKSKKCAKKIELLYVARETVIKLFNNYSSIASETKYKAIH